LIHNLDANDAGAGFYALAADYGLAGTERTDNHQA
jgi:hypothetical protein